MGGLFGFKGLFQANNSILEIAVGSLNWGLLGSLMIFGGWGKKKEEHLPPLETKSDPGAGEET